MKTVGTRELKNRLSSYLGLVRRGETVVVTVRGRTIAQIIPPNPKTKRQDSLGEILKQLEAEGHLRLGTLPFKRIKPLRLKGKPASEIILEDRD